jgi:hypothetical protein
MSAPAAVPVPISVSANLEAGRVIYQFGDQRYGLTVEDTMILMSQSMAAMEALRPAAADAVLQ